MKKWKKFLVVDKFLAKLSAAIHRALVIAARTINGCLNQTGMLSSLRHVFTECLLLDRERKRASRNHALFSPFVSSFFFFNISLEI